MLHYHLGFFNYSLPLKLLNVNERKISQSRGNASYPSEAKKILLCKLRVQRVIFKSLPNGIK